MRKTKTDEQMYLNNLTYLNFLDRLRLIAVSIFEWEGLDEIGGNSRFLEATLYSKGKAVFVKDKTLGYLTLEANPSDKLNIYNLPTKINATSYEYNKEYKLEDVVYILNNDIMLPTASTINVFAYRLYQLETTISININAQKTPILLQGTDKQRLMLENLYMQYDGNIPFIFGDKDLDIGNIIKSISTKAEFIADKLTIQKHEVWNEILTYLGINNANTDKKERLITDEVNSNNELINFYLACFLKTRMKAAKEINNKFFEGKEVVKISINKNVADLISNTKNDIIDVDKEGVNNE